MTSRYFAKDGFSYGVKGVPSGFEGTAADAYTVQPCGIEDVDRAFFRLFDDELSIQAVGREGPKKVPIVFAAGEKWAQVKKGNGLRDASGTLILPLIVMARTDFVQSFRDDIAGRGINQAVGSITIRRKASPLDRSMQNLINRELIRNQQNVAVSPGDVTVDGQVATARDVGLLSDDPTIADGGLLVSDLRSNITETVTLPTPQFVTVKYDITLWAQHQQQMNQIVEGLMSSYLPQIRGWKIDTDKGYWFIANVVSDDFRNQGNGTEQTGQERVIKHSMQVDVPAYVIASSAPGVPLSVRTRLMNPIVSFDVVTGGSGESFEPSVVDEPFLGADDPTLPLAVSSDRRDSRDSGHGRIFPNPSALDEHDPALEGFRRGQKPSRWRSLTVRLPSGMLEKKYVRITSRNVRTGDLTFDAAQLEGGTIVSVDD